MKPRSDSYEESLSEEKCEQLHALLSDSSLSLMQLRELVPVWGSGPRDGSKPSIASLSAIAARLRRDMTIDRVEDAARMMEQVHVKLSGKAPQEILDTVIQLIGQEVIQKTLEGEDPKNRTAAARLLLKREDQKLDHARFQRETCKLFLEWFQNEQAKAIATSTETNSAKIEKLGQAMFGDSWR